MTLEKELLDFTNWLYNNNWKLIGDGMCLNTETKQIGLVKQLVIESVSFGDYYPQDFQAEEIVRVKDNGNEVKLTRVDYNKYDQEYQYWYEDEEGEE